MTPRDDASQRMQVYRYVCACGVTHPPRAQGWQTLSQLFVDRPTTCRYAVVTVPPDIIWGIDLYETLVDIDGRLVLGPHTVFPDVDTAVMTLSMQYP
jgi:hypothetical protein